MPYEVYKHTPYAQPHTVRDLARALGVPDDVPLAVPEDRRLMVACSDFVGSEDVGDRQIVVEILPNYDNSNYLRDTPPDPVFYLGGDFEEGEYDRWKS